MVVAAFVFQSFTPAIRQANFAAVASVGDSYDSGIRSYYFAPAAVAWVVSPLLMILATVGVVAQMLHRLAHSRTAIALDDIARVRAG